MKRFIACLAVPALLAAAGCIHTQPSTGLSYLLHDEYEVFHFDESPVITPSNFVGFCMLPMEKVEDERAMGGIELLEYALDKHGYTKVTQEELLAEPRLIPRTFMVGLGYNQSFAYETVEAQINLYVFDQRARQNKLFWSWKGKLDGYPFDRDTFMPMLNDLFVLEPIDWFRHETIFPRCGATSNQIESFMIDLAAARLKIIQQRNETL